jgi:hypothetical protein
MYVDRGRLGISGCRFCDRPDTFTLSCSILRYTEEICSTHQSHKFQYAPATFYSIPFIVHKPNSNTREFSSVISNHMPVICDFAVTLLSEFCEVLNKCHYVCDHKGSKERWARRRCLSFQEQKVNKAHWHQGTHLELTHPWCTLSAWRRPQRHLCSSSGLRLQKLSNMCRMCCWSMWNWHYSGEVKLSTYNLCPTLSALRVKSCYSCMSSCHWRSCTFPVFTKL